MAAVDWKTVAAQKRDSILPLIPQEWRIEKVPSAAEQKDVTGPFIQGYLNAREVEITETDAVGIVAKTSTGEWTAEEVARAFCHRAALAHQLVNCLHEIFFNAAIEDAKKLDAYFTANKKPIGPLHGLPVSLKDQFHVKDVDTHMGYVGWIGTFEGKTGTGKERVFESELVRELRSLGAVLFCKTSVPHTLMCGETINNIMGYTWNPKNRTLITGGSSGGEGALIACRGSPIGFGTDIAGSIRIPSGFNGLYGLRPSTGRFPYAGMANSMDGQSTVLSVVGPLATSAPALKLMAKAVLSQEPWFQDPFVNEIPWRTEHEKPILDMLRPGGEFKKLSFGLLKDDGMVRPTPPIRRGMDMIVKAMEKLGHEVIEWKPPSHRKSMDVALAAFVSDAGKDVRAAFELSGEPMIPALANVYGEDRGLVEATASQIAATNVAKRETVKEYMDYWNSTAALTSTGRPVDAIISPIAPYPPPRPDNFRYYGYTVWVNVMDYTSVVVPVTFADKEVDKVDEGYTPMNEEDKVAFESYDPEVFDGAPVALQLVGRRLQEEKMLAIAEYVAEALKKA